MKRALSSIDRRWVEAKRAVNDASPELNAVRAAWEQASHAAEWRDEYDAAVFNYAVAWATVAALQS